MAQRFIVILPALQAVEWIVSTDEQQSLDIVKQLHHFLPSNGNESALNIETVRSIHCRTCELPAAVRAFCVHALPGNPVLWPHQALMSSPKAELVTAIVDVVADLVFDAAFQSEAALMMNTVPVDVAESGHAHLCVQQLWVSGMGVSISSLLKKRNYTITACVVRLLQWIAIRAPHEVSTRRVLLGTPNISVVADVLAGIAESAAFKGGGLRKKAV